MIRPRQTDELAISPGSNLDLRLSGDHLPWMTNLLNRFRFHDGQLLAGT
jgi:hypothetical protein